MRAERQKDPVQAEEQVLSVHSRQSGAHVTQGVFPRQERSGLIASAGPAPESGEALLEEGLEAPDLFEPQFPHLCNGGNNSLYLGGGGDCEE